MMKCKYSVVSLGSPGKNRKPWYHRNEIGSRRISSLNHPRKKCLG